MAELFSLLGGGGTAFEGRGGGALLLAGSAFEGRGGGTREGGNLYGGAALEGGNLYGGGALEGGNSFGGGAGLELLTFCGGLYPPLGGAEGLTTFTVVVFMAGRFCWVMAHVLVCFPDNFVTTLVRTVSNMDLPFLDVKKTATTTTRANARSTPKTIPAINPVK